MDSVNDRQLLTMFGTRLLRSAFRSPAGSICTNLREAFARVDYEVAFMIDRIRRGQLRLQRLDQLQQELEAKLAALAEINSLASPNDLSLLQQQRVQLQWVLDQIRQPQK